MAQFESSDSGFDGALRAPEPKVPPRRRRAPAADNESEGTDGAAATNSPPAPKKSVGGGWANVDSVAAPAASGGESTAIGSMNAASGKEDEDIMMIPDLEEADEDDITMAVAEPGAVTGAALPTNLTDEQGLLPPSMVGNPSPGAKNARNYPSAVVGRVVNSHREDADSAGRPGPVSLSLWWCGVWPYKRGSTLGATQGKILSQSPTCATSRYLRKVALKWELTKETIYLPLGCLQGGTRDTFWCWQADGIDLSLLYEVILPKKQLQVLKLPLISYGKTYNL